MTTREASKFPHLRVVRIWELLVVEDGPSREKDKDRRKEERSGGKRWRESPRPRNRSFWKSLSAI